MYNVFMEMFREVFIQLFSNHVLIATILSWLAAQIIKLIVNAVQMHTIEWSRLLGNGGMPSSHSATVTGLALMTGLKQGFNSAYFAIAFVLAAVVIKDAIGVRKETEKQTRVIEQMLERVNRLSSNAKLGILAPREKLKKFVGHNLQEVVCGVIVGIAVSIAYYVLWVLR